MQNGTPVMVGNIPSFVALVKREAIHDTGMHCCTDWLALVSKTWPITLKEVFSATVKAVNFIRARSLMHRFCMKFGHKVE